MDEWGIISAGNLTYRRPTLYPSNRMLAGANRGDLVQSKLQILVVDDDPNIRELVKYNLTLDGFGVSLAEDGRQALKLVGEGSYDLVLLDVMMPELDGLQVLAELKGSPQTASLPVFMLTAKGMVSDMERAFKIGADDYIAKPFDPEELGKKIEYKLKNMARRKKC